MGRLIWKGSLSVAALGALLFLLAVSYFWSHAGDFERLGIGRRDAFAAMLQLRFTPAPYVEIGGRPDVVLVRSQENLKNVDIWMARTGYARVDQMGTMIYYHKSGQEETVESLALTALFRLCRVESVGAPKPIRNAGRVK